MAREDIVPIVTGAFFALVVLVVVVITSRDVPDLRDCVKTLITECEKNLPRSEHCVLVAVPVSKD